MTAGMTAGMTRNRVSVRLTKATLAAVVVAAVLHLLTRVTGVGWLALGSAAALAVPLTSLVMRPALDSLEVHLEGPERVVAGASLEQVLHVRNASRRSTPPAHWVDRTVGLEPAEVDVPALGPGQSTQLPVLRQALSRGVYDGASALLWTTAPFGALRWERAVPGGRVLKVHPESDRGRRLTGGGMRTDQRTAPVAGAGLEVLGLRPWRPGDSTRGVSARASARHGRPVVLERERELAAGPALLVLAAGGSAGEAWERHVSTVASTALAALRDGRRVTMVVGDGGPVVPRTLDATGVLDVLAGIDRAGALSMADVKLAMKAVHPGGRVLFLAGARAGMGLGKGPGCCVHEVLGG